MSDALGLSIGTTNLVAIRDGRPPLTRRSIVTLFNDHAPEVGAPGEYPNPGQPGLMLTSFVDRVGDPVAIVAPDGSSHRAEYVLVDALDAMARAVGGGEPVTIAVPSHWSPAVVGALRAALRTKPSLSPDGVAPSIIPDAGAALTGLRTSPGLPPNGIVVLADFGGTGTSITLADASAGLAIIGDTVRYHEFSGELIDQALLNHVVAGIAEANDADTGSTAAVGSLARLRDECRRAKERLSGRDRDGPGRRTARVHLRLPGDAVRTRALDRPSARRADQRDRRHVAALPHSAVEPFRSGDGRRWSRHSACHATTLGTTPRPRGDHACTTARHRRGAFVVGDLGLAPDTPTGMGPVADAATGLAATMGWAAESPPTEQAPAAGVAHVLGGRAGVVAGRHEARSSARTPARSTTRPTTVPPTRARAMQYAHDEEDDVADSGAARLVQAAADSLRGRCGGVTARRGRPRDHADEFVGAVRSGHRDGDQLLDRLERQHGPGPAAPFGVADGHHHQAER